MLGQMKLWQAAALLGVALSIAVWTLWRSAAVGAEASRVPEPVTAPAVPGIAAPVNARR